MSTLQQTTPLRKCRGFRSKSLDERKAYLREKNICYRCCSSTKTVGKMFSSENARANGHAPVPAPWITETSATTRDQGGKQEEGAPQTVTSKCTDISGTTEIMLQNLPRRSLSSRPERERAVKAYVVLDEQSNKSLARTEFFKLSGIKEGTAAYTLKTCSGVIETTGQRANNFIMESLNGKTHIPLPTVIECNMLPDDMSEIPTPEITRHYKHFQRVMDRIPALDSSTAILILLSWDIPRAHKVWDQCNGPHNTPYAQRLNLGWVIVGEVCHKSDCANVYWTHVLSHGRTSLFDPCTNSLHIKEKPDAPVQHHHFPKANQKTCLMKKITLVKESFSKHHMTTSLPCLWKTKPFWK